jgi:hypothetical protein
MARATGTIAPLADCGIVPSHSGTHSQTQTVSESPTEIGGGSDVIRAPVRAVFFRVCGQRAGPLGDKPVEREIGCESHQGGRNSKRCQPKHEIALRKIEHNQIPPAARRGHNAIGAVRFREILAPAKIMSLRGTHR